MKTQVLTKHVLFVFFLCLIFACRKKVEAPVVLQPFACFSASGYSQKTNDIVRFTNCSENFESVEWDFDDGTTANVVTPTHQWTNNGVYNISLNVVKANLQNKISKKILIANQVQMDFAVTMKNFKGAVTTNTFSCIYSAINSLNQQQVFLNMNYPSINNPNYIIKADISNLYFGNDVKIKHRFKLVAKNNFGAIDSLITDEIDIVESPTSINKSAKLNFCDLDYAINLRYQ